MLMLKKSFICTISPVYVDMTILCALNTQISYINIPKHTDYMFQNSGLQTIASICKEYRALIGILIQIFSFICTRKLSFAEVKNNVGLLE